MITPISKDVLVPESQCDDHADGVLMKTAGVSSVWWYREFAGRRV